MTRARDGATRRLFHAIESGNPVALQAAINDGADVNAERDDETPLMLAAREGSLDVVRALVAAGAHVNAWLQGDTALSTARSAGRDSVVEFLWPLADEDTRRHAETPDDAFQADTTPLGEALRQGREGDALALVRAGADPNATAGDEQAPLIVAADHGYLDVVRALVEAGADVNRKDGGETALEAAARAERDDVLAYLEPLVSAKVRAAGRRAGVAARKRRGGSLSLDAQLVRAAWEGRVAQARELLARGASANAYDEVGQTALMQAASGGSPAMIALLLEAGADCRAAARAPSAVGETALHRAIGGAWTPERAAVLHQLLASGADPNARHERGATPLHYAAEVQAGEAWRILVGAGADPSIRNADGMTPADIRTGDAGAALDAAFDRLAKRLRNGER